MSFFGNVLNTKARLGLSSQLLLGLLLLSGLYAISATALQSWWVYQHNEDRVASVMKSVDRYYLPKIQQSLVGDDQYQLKLVAKELLQEPDVHTVYISTGAEIVTTVGKQLSAERPAKRWTFVAETYGELPKTYQLLVEINTGMSWIGSPIQIIQVFAIQMLCAMAFALGFYFLVKSRLINPIRMIAKRIGDIDASNLPKPLHLPQNWYNDEMVEFNERYSRSVERLRNTYSELSQRCLEAEEAKKRKSESMAMVSREIRTSLNGMYGLITLLRENPSQEDLKEYAALLQSSAGNLQDLINDIHDLSQIEIGGLVLSNGPLDIADLVSEVDAAFRGSASEKELLFQCTVDSSISHFLYGDKSRLRQILRILISNAIRFTDNGYVLLDVQHLAYDDKSETILFEVKDSGIGVDKAQHESIFDIEDSASAVDSFSGKGAGLRLGISRQLVRLMGGELSLDSEAGLGSHFYFTLKFDSQREEAPVGSSQLAGRRVLIVDDSEFNNKITSLQLSKLGLRVDTCEDGIEAVSMLWNAAHDSQPYQLVLLDKNMPRMSGTELAVHMHEQLKESTPPIMMVSAERLALADLKKFGIQGYLMRPYRSDELERLIYRLLNIELETQEDAQAAIAEAEYSHGVKVLLVEDQVSNQVVMKKMLQRLNVNVSIAENGRIAVSRCAVEHYDLVLMDCQMPVMDGFEATISIRKMEEGSSVRVPIVALTANVLAEEKSRCYEVGMDGFVSKPVNVSKLSQTLRKHIPNFESSTEMIKSPFTASSNIEV
ncbi:response regulator [Vibrio sp. SCSIO 43136]|uniref:response regulator n=1 Tax=Vibrio sp. SCSIO 43136 TaxID=2819101 RepID=UPI0020752808|nr:response regulator [Vibrio sp. SCSIO 43136]USD67632.1 response regulator [Vibrio sp. SCSIO 43136]